MYILLELVFAFVWVVLGVAAFEAEDGSDEKGEVEEVEFQLSPDPKAMDVGAAEALQWFVIKNTGEAMQVFGKPPPALEGPEDEPENKPEDMSGMDRALQLLVEFNATTNHDENHREGRVRVLLGCYYGCSPVEFDPEDVSTLTPEDVVRNLACDRWWGFREEPAIKGPTEATADQLVPPEACWKCGGLHPADQHPVEEWVMPEHRAAGAAFEEREEGVEEEWCGSQASWEDYINSYPSDYSDTASNYSEPMTEQEHYDFDHGC